MPVDPGSIPGLSSDTDHARAPYVRTVIISVQGACTPLPLGVLSEPLIPY